MYRVCPKCGSTDVRRSRRRGLYEKLILKMRRLRPYRCERCDHRFRDSIALFRLKAQTEG